MNRRHFLLSAGAFGLAPTLALAGQAGEPRSALIGAAWRGPRPTDPYFAGILATDWQEKSLRIRYAVPLPTRPHGLIAEEDGGLTVLGVRPGAWMLRCDGQGAVTRQIRLEEEGEGACRLGGHAEPSPDGRLLYTTETDQRTGRGRVGVRDRQTLRKVAEWDSHGIDPHQLLADEQGHLMVANGGVPRTPADKKYDLHRMDSSLVRLDGKGGQLLRQWRLDDTRLSLRHLAWSRGTARRLGIAMQAEHDDAAQRGRAPLLAVLEDDRLFVPTADNDGFGYAGDIVATFNGGFTVSSNLGGVARLWHPGAPEKMTSVVQFKESYALAPWQGASPGGGVLVATALGLVRWHPSAPALFLPWPEPMALDNHWVLASET